MASLWIIQNQFGRRNLSAYSRSVLALRLEEILKSNAKLSQGTRTDLGFELPHYPSPYKRAEKALELERNITENSTESRTDRETRTQIAKTAKVSSNTIARVKVIEAKATADKTK